MVVEEVVGFHGGGGAHPRRGDYLAEMRVGGFASGKHARDIGALQVIDFDIAFIIEVQLALKKLGVGGMTDEYEHAIGGVLPGFASDQVLQADRFDGVFADDLSNNGIPDKFDFRIGLGALL